MKTAAILDDISKIGGVGTGSTSADSEALAWAIDNAPAHGRIGIPGELNLQIDPTMIPTITSPVTIEGRGGKPLLAAQSVGTMFNIASDHVTIRNMRSVGSDKTNPNDQLIRSVGTAAIPFSNMVVEDLITSGFWSVVRIEHVNNFNVSGLTLDAPEYVGVMGLSVTKGEIDRVRVSGLGAPSVAAGNSYGVALSRIEADTLTEAPRSSWVTVSNCAVDGAPWEAYDTHGGEHLSFVNCKANNAVTGLAIVPSNSSGNATEMAAPRHIAVSGCDFSTGNDLGDSASGIVVRGAFNGGSVSEYTTNVSISSTILDRYGDQNASTLGALTMYGTKGVSFQGGITEPTQFGVVAYYSNYGFHVNATVIDPWTDTGAICGAFVARSGDNEGKIDIALARGDKTANRVAEYGAVIYSPATTAITGKANDFKAATIAEVSGTLLAGQV